MIDASIGMTAPGFDGGGRETGPTETVNRGAMEAILSASHGDPARRTVELPYRARCFRTRLAS